MTKGTMVRVRFKDRYGHDRAETAEVVRHFGDVPFGLVRVTWMEHGEDQYLTTPASEVEVLAARVTYGWSCYDDYATMEEALQRAATLARQPMKDPLCQRVAILDLTRREGKYGTLPTLLEVRRPAEAPVEEATV